MPRLIIDSGGPRCRLQLLPDAPPRGLTRGARQMYTNIWKQMQNDRASWFKLELVLYANFSPDDLFVTLTYAGNVPAYWRDTKSNVPAFMRRYRRQLAAEELSAPRYVYVHEALHGDGRPHHHMVLSAAGDDAARIAQCWPHGSVDVESIRAFGGYQKLAMYITKEPREKGKPVPGERMWTPSRNLIRPEHIVEQVPADYRLAAPEGARPLAEGLLISQRLESDFGGAVQRLDFILPQKTNIAYNILA